MDISVASVLCYYDHFIHIHSACARVFQRNVEVDYVRIGDKGDKTSQFPGTKGFPSCKVFIVKNRQAQEKMV